MWLDEEHQTYKIWRYGNANYIYHVPSYKPIALFEPQKGAKVVGQFVEAWGPPPRAWEPKNLEFSHYSERWRYELCHKCPSRWRDTGVAEVRQQIVAKVRRKRTNENAFRPVYLCEKHAKMFGVIW